MSQQRQAERIAAWAEQQSKPAPLPARIGRPPAFETHEAFEAAVDAYFADCVVRQQPYTMSGLANALGISRVSLMNYEHRDARFLNTVKRARAAVEQQLEEGLLTREKQVAGHIFNLKNNFGWKDTQEIEHTHSVIVVGVPGHADQRLEPPVIDVTPTEPLSLVPHSDLACGNKG